MYNKETLKKIAEVLKLDVSTFEANLKSDKEETLEVPALFTEDDKNKFGENRFNEGKKAASEILVKDLKQKHAIEFEGKSIDGFLDKYSEKVIADAKIAPDEKVKKLADENKTLKDNLQAAIGKEQTLAKEYADKLFHVETRSEILSHIPEKTIIPREDLAVLFMNSYSVAKEDDRVIVYKGSDPIKDNVLNPVPLKTVISQFAEKYIDKNGMGGGDSGGGATGKFKTMTSFMDHCKKNNIEPMGEAGQKLLAENKEAAFDYNS
jgi:ribosomal protein S13